MYPAFRAEHKRSEGASLASAALKLSVELISPERVEPAAEAKLELGGMVT